MFKKIQVLYEREYDMMAMRLLVVHGPNLNLLGTREPQTYGSTTLAELNAQIEQFAQKENVSVVTFQSNHEGGLIDRIHQAKEEAINFIVINPGAFTHTSIALRDALAGVDIPFIEVHLSNVHSREKFRHHSYFSDLAVGVIAGFGTFGYLAAMQHAINQHNLLHR